VDVLRGALQLSDVLDRVEGGPVRLSPVVASELLRGASTKAARRSLERLVSSLVPIEPPSWRNAWFDAGRTLPKLFAQHESVGLGRLQNDLLLALTARHTGAMFVSRDKHFRTLQRRLRFRAVLLD
jgi:predicted nucleic acid-binding protein